MLDQIGSAAISGERGALAGASKTKKAARLRGTDNNGWSHHAVIAAAGRSPDDVAHGFSQS